MKGNVKELAKVLGVSRTAIYFNMRKWEISPEDFRSD
jgi:transcriptional regulator of acetoin/glycerol metabolism